MMQSLLSFDQAFQTALALASPIRCEVLPLPLSRNRVLAKNARAEINVPPFRRAMMDGFALRHQDVNSVDSQLEIVGSIAAGDSPDVVVHAGQAVRIMTGAAIPQGADSVARFEWCNETRDGYVNVLRTFPIGESVQEIGEDGGNRQVIIRQGEKLTGLHLATCKAFGISHVHASIPPTVVIVLTGSELVEDVTTPLQMGQIYGSNEVFIQHAIEDDGGQVTAIHYVGDDKRSIRRVLGEASHHADYVIVTGGVSVGDFDFVPEVIHELGGDLSIRKILMRPGSPFVASKVNRATVFGLSGNPAACFIQFETLVRPTIRCTLGLPDVPFPSSGKIAHSLELKPIKHTRILRANARVSDGTVYIDTRLSQSPGIMSSLAASDCLVRLEANKLTEGAVVPLRWIRSL